jgi:hypothetical protein
MVGGIFVTQVYQLRMEMNKKVSAMNPASMNFSERPINDLTLAFT